jgi:hypothetical protein
MSLSAVSLAALLLGPAPLPAIGPAVAAPPVGNVQFRSELREPRRRFYVFVTVRPVSLPKQPDANYLGLVGVDHEGRALDGRHRYLVHFPPAELPPNDALWSLTALESDPFADPPKADGMIGCGAKLRFNADGSLDLYLQRTRPASVGVNWVRTPAGSFNVLAHLRWPGAPHVPSDWRLPRVQRLD